MNLIFPITLSAILLVLNYEYFFINAEGIFIISFLLFVFAFYFFAGESLGNMLDDTSNEISKKIKEVNILQLQALRENKATLATLKNLNNKLIPLILYVLQLIEVREDKLEDLQQKFYRNFIEKKLKDLLLENAQFQSQSFDALFKEIMQKYEQNLK